MVLISMVISEGSNDPMSQSMEEEEGSDQKIDV